jgi:hypothetical protein
MSKPRAITLVIARHQLQLMNCWYKWNKISCVLTPLPANFSPWPHANTTTHAGESERAALAASGGSTKPHGYIFDLQIQKALEMKFNPVFHIRFGTRAEFEAEKVLLRVYIAEVLDWSHNDALTPLQNFAIVVTGHVKELSHIAVRRSVEFTWMTHACPMHFPPDDNGANFQPKFLALQVRSHHRQYNTFTTVPPSPRSHQGRT